jgi:hypothetical protein
VTRLRASCLDRYLVATHAIQTDELDLCAIFFDPASAKGQLLRSLHADEFDCPMMLDSTDGVWQQAAQDAGVLSDQEGEKEKEEAEEPGNPAVLAIPASGAGQAEEAVQQGSAPVMVHFCMNELRQAHGM